MSIIYTRCVKSIFDRLGIQCAIEENILVAKWQKFLFNCGLNPLTALTRKRLGALLASSQGRELFEALVDEAIAVARAHGAPLPAGVRDEIMEVAARMDISSSMAEDLACGRPIELDAFSGLVCRLGRAHNTAVPVTQVIYNLLATVNSAANTRIT